MGPFIKLHWFIAFAGLGLIINGVLHDFYVLRQRRPFQRDLIRLLIDGHILIFSGIMYLVCYSGIRDQFPLAFTVSIVTAFFQLGYCGFIFKLVPVYGTIVVNFIALLWLLMKFPL